MTFKKRACKTVAIALVGITISVPSFSSINAMELNKTPNEQTTVSNSVLDTFNMNEEEFAQAKKTRDNFTSETEESERFSNEQVNLSKIEFQQKYGSEDKFIFIEEYENIRSEANGARGIIRLTDLNSGEVEIMDYFNILDGLRDEYENDTDNLDSRATPSRPGAWRTQGPDQANISVKKGSSRDTIKASNPVTGNIKTYTKNTNDWYSGYTKGYYDNVRKARQSWGTAKEHAGYSAQSALTAVATNFIKQQQWFPNQNKFLTAFRALAAGNAIVDAVNASRYGVAYLGNMSSVFTNYLNL